MDGNEIRHESALIGSTGFVGSLLQRQVSFANYYRSTTIGNIEGKRFNIVVCSAAPAQNGSQIVTPSLTKQILMP